MNILRLVKTCLRAHLGLTSDRIWLGVAAAVALAIGVGLWRIGSGVVPVAVAAEARLSELSQALRGGEGLGTGDWGPGTGESFTNPKSPVPSPSSEVLDGLYYQVSQVAQELGPVGDTARWAGRFAPVVAWFPVAQQEITAWVGQVERARKDLSAASSLLALSSQLLDLYSDAQAALATQDAANALPSLKARAGVLETGFFRTTNAFARASHRQRQCRDGEERPKPACSVAKASRMRQGILLQTPAVRDLTTLLGNAEERMLSASEAGREVSGLLVELLDLAEAAQPLMEIGKGGFQTRPYNGVEAAPMTIEPYPRSTFAQSRSYNGVEAAPMTIESLSDALTRLDERAKSARARASNAARLVEYSGQADWLLPRLNELDSALIAVSSIARAGRVAFEALEGVDMSSPVNGGLLHAFEALSARSDEIAAAIAELEEAQLRVQGTGYGVQGDDTPNPVPRTLYPLVAGLQLISSIAPIAREALGAEGVRRYLVLGQSADELRATGGFVSSVWLVTFEGGRLADVRYEDAVRVDDWDRLALYPKAPPGLEEHMGAWVWLLRDVSWDADFPTTAQAAQDIYRLGRRQDVDGVIAINQWTIQRLIEAVGEIPSPNGEVPLTPSGFISALEQGTDEHGRAYMDLVLQGLLDRLGNPVSMAELIRLASALRDTLQSRDTLVYLDDPRLQQAVSDLGWDGRIRQDGADYLYVVDSNVGWSKVDRNIERRVSYVVDLRRESAPRASLRLEYLNHSAPGSSPCEPQWLNRGASYGQLKNACYWDFLTVYMPQRARLLNATPLPLPEYSVAVNGGYGTPGQDTGAVSSLHGKLVFSGLTAIEAGARSEIVLAYDLPASVVQKEGDRLTYQLLVQKQPGVQGRRVEVELLLPEGYSLTQGALPPAQTSESRVSFVFDLTQDTTLKVELARDADG
jgi:hypothetical protein